MMIEQPSIILKLLFPALAQKLTFAGLNQYYTAN